MAPSDTLLDREHVTSSPDVLDDGGGAPDVAGRSSWPEVDNALVEEARSDPEAFSKLYLMYAGRVFGLACHRLGNRQSADDVTAATFERAWRAMPSFQPRNGGFPAWLLRITTNQITDHIRREARTRTPRGQRAMSFLTEQCTDDTDAIVENDDPVLRAALSKIRPRYAEALTLRYLVGLTSAEAAAQVGLSANTFAVLLRRAKAALRRELRREDEQSMKRSGTDLEDGDDATA